MKKKLLLVGLFLIGIGTLAEAKPRHAFPNTPDEVGQNDRDLDDQINERVERSSNSWCIDSPTFCVDDKRHQVVVASGAATAPQFRLYSMATNSGVYSTGDNFRIAIAGAAKLRLDSTGLFSTPQIFAANGSASAPGFAFDLDTDTGFFSTADNAIRASVGGTQLLKLFYISSGDLGVQMVDSASVFQNNTGSASTPTYTFSGDTNTGIYSAGADIFSITGGGTELARFQKGGTNVLEMRNSSVILLNDGTVTAPAIAFSNATGTGLYRYTAGGNNIPAIASQGTIVWRGGGGGQSWYIDGNEELSQTSAALFPGSDNTDTIGRSGNRWSAVWAANGTIQTSSSKLKKNIREIIVGDDGVSLVPVNPDSIQFAGKKIIEGKTKDEKDSVVKDSSTVNKYPLPRPIMFQWVQSESTGTVNADHIGYMGDDLPLEAHALREDGTRDPQNFYSSAVIGILCAHVKHLEEEVALLKAELKIKKP